MVSMNIMLPEDLTTLHRNGGDPLLKAYTEMRDCAAALHKEARETYSALYHDGADRSVYEAAYRRAIILQTLFLYYDTVVDYFEDYEKMIKEALDVDHPAEETL